MPRETRPSKFSSPRSSTATRASRSSGGMRAVYDFQEGTANEGSPTLVGFEDARPGWVRFLAGLGGVQGPDVSGMNAQLALAREGTTAQRELQTEKLRAELEQMREGAKHNLALEEIRNKYRLGQIGAEQAAALMNNLATNYAQHKGRMAELIAGGEQNRMTQAEGSRQKIAEQLATEYKLDPNNPQQRAALDELINARMATKVANAKSDEGKQALTLGERARDIGDYFDKVAKSRVIVNQNDAVFQPEIEALGVPPNMYRGQSTEEGIGPGGFPVKRTIAPSSTAIPSRRSMMTAPAGAPQQESVMLNPKWLQPSAPQPKASTAVAEPRPELQVDYNPGVPSVTDVAKLLRIWPFVQQQAAKQEVSNAVPAQREPVGDGTGLFGPAWRAFKQAF